MIANDDKNTPIATMRRKREWPEGVPMPPAGAWRGSSKWDRHEEQALRDWYPKYGAKYVARLLGRSVQAVAARASSLGITTPSPIAGKPRPYARRGWSQPPWTDKDDARLRDLHERGQSPRRIAEALKRTKIDVTRRSQALGLYRLLRKWTAVEDRLLRTQYGRMSYTELAAELDRSVAAVTGRVATLGIARQRAPRWTDADIQRLRALHGTMPVAELATLMNRSVDAITIRAGRLGLTAQVAEPWTAREDEQLAELHRNGTGYAAIAAALGRSPAAVGGRATKLGLTTSQRMRAPSWTKRELATLRKRYGTVRNRVLAERLGRSIHAIAIKARELGLGGEPGRAWTAKEDRYIKRHYGTMPQTAIAEALQRTRPAVAGRAGFLGVSRKRAPKQEAKRTPKLRRDDGE